MPNPLSFSAPSPESMNSLLPGFEFTAVVSSNAVGAVYFANQISLDRQVVIKIFAPDPERKGTIRNKARAVAGLNHSNLIAMLDSGSVEGMSYLVMEFVPGKSLARSTRGKSVDFEQAMVLIDGICEGLAYAHDNGVVHGYFNSSNVLLNQQAQPKIGNFGVPHSTQGDPVADTARHFIAPEVLGMSAGATKQSDVYSVAAVFYELLAGREHGPDVPPPSELCGCRPEVDAVLKQATDADPAKRMADVRAFQTALKEALKGRQLKPALTQRASAVAKASKRAPSRKKPAEVAKVGFDWKLVRNLVIIVALLCVCTLAWKGLKNARAGREKENREILAKEAATKEKDLAEAAQKKAEELAGLRKTDVSKTVISDVPKHIETPAESLERLRSRLKSGARSELPVGSVRKAECDYFFVSQPMTWADAAWFAESHGGHLAIPDPDADSGWLFEEMAKDENSWIGAARSSENSWISVNGIIWNPSAEPTGSGSYLAVGEGGSIRAESSGTLRPFIIQWHSDGSNPGALASQFEATRGSLSQSAPLFPPGTASFGDRHYLYVSRPSSWQQAGEFAESAGGQLLVVSDTEEAGHLRGFAGKLKAKDGIWLGGSLDDSHWRWVSGESWTTAAWADGADGRATNSALIIRPGKGWDGRDREDDASGFIIEWSNDAESAKSADPKAAAPGGDAAGLTARVKEVILATEQKRSEAHVANVKKISWDLDAFVRGLNKSGQQQWRPEVERLKACTEGDRFLPEQVQSEEITMSPEMSKIANYAARKQEEIDKKFAETAKAIRDSFIEKLAEIRDAAQKSGQLKVAEDIDETIAAAAAVGSWVGSFGLELPQ